MHFPLPKKKHSGLHIMSDADLITKNSDPSLVEAFRAARINLMYTLADLEDKKAILVTSAFSAEGKTTTSINLAVTFAQTEAKVLLVDADMRKPRVHTYLGVKNKNGLANYLGGFAPIESVINRMKDYNFDYITAGDIPPNPADLLSSQKFAAFVEEVKKQYNYIFFDTPPVNAVADALSIIPSIKNVALICRCGVSINSEIKRAIAALEFAQAKILGFITINAQNRVSEYKPHSGYYCHK